MTLSPQSSRRWDELPHEILLQILCYLEPHQLPRLQLVSRKLRDVCLDDELWKRHCFERSPWYSFLQNRRKVFASLPDSSLSKTSQDDEDAGSLLEFDESSRKDKDHFEFLQDMANWDPAFPDEHVSWYDEYIQRQGPTSINWLETPRAEQSAMDHFIEVRGMALYRPNNGDDGLGSLLAVSPLDDGSVCLWDINGARSRRGGIIATSQPDILFFDGRGDQNTRRSKKIDTGVTECVSVDNTNNRAVFAVQSHLIEVDLNRLQVVNRHSFEWSITTLSQIQDGIPLTVGTSLGIHLQDFRAPQYHHGNDVERLDIDSPMTDGDNPFRAIFDPNPLPPYASLSQPTPTSILHLPRPAGDNTVSDDIYVAGRFSNILHYDRRQFPKILGSIYSGSRLSSLAALPYPFSTLDHEVRRRGELSAERVHECKTSGNGRTLIAGGEYKTKGSLELYGLDTVDLSSDGAMQQNSTMKNRYTAASSIILSVIDHGTKVAFSDGAGQIKWFERDGYTECRRIKIGHSDVPTQASLFASMPGSDDLARKILSTKTAQDRPNEDNVLFWTGDKLGMVSFTGDTLFTPEQLQGDKNHGTKEAAADEQKRQVYSQRMREALEKQADEARFVQGLGL
ncbi:hypothetical protein FVEN_g3165 [Fusarium venenatum]|uniref:F-box domain-containing protein n=1 Tax=Fusarium venenatum TaxID=56646 RepID=A0A2L2TW07_9HYPO|nr:uncharacterized protein FVRRES_01157 [Fusarium venenatum]KAG8359062.1 hypothetical protein FVEN_g3165 [Fusarium venenatum]CEI64645.1 unnamed protein product [Fusarium venenatum]